MTESFAQLFEQSLANQRIRPGMILSGLVVDVGSDMVVVNVEKLRVTGAKESDKKYFRHSTYPGGIYETNFKKLQARHPDRVLKLAVKGILPKGRLGYAMIKKLKIYAGPAHPHASQQPKSLEI